MSVPTVRESGDNDESNRHTFAGHVRRTAGEGTLIVQPRMGFSAPDRMRDGLIATQAARATTVGTITLDSYTRVGDYAAVDRALARGTDLNGYPIVNYGRTITRRVLEGVHAPGFPVQVRHGSPAPEQIFRALADVGIDATEGGPVSYCLPYSRVPLRSAVNHWARSCELFAEMYDDGHEPHLESFGGCMLGQLCPPSLLIAISVLEGLFFRQHGIRSVSLSYAQQTNATQDTEALHALHKLAAEYLADLDWHIVLYAYMGVYPRTRVGASRLLSEAAELAVHVGAARLIVKTAAEAHRIPTIADNVEALETAASAATAVSREPVETVTKTRVLAESRALIETVLDLDPDVGVALYRAFDKGYLDIPYCLHGDNRGNSRSYVDVQGKLTWSNVGSMPIEPSEVTSERRRVTASDLLASLSYVERKFDSRFAPVLNERF